MSGVPNQPFCWTPLPLAVQVSQEQSCPDQSVGNRTSFRSGGGPSQLSVRKSFSILGWPSKVIPNISNVSRSKLSTPGQTEIRERALGVFLGIDSLMAMTMSRVSLFCSEEQWYMISNRASLL